MKQIVIPGYGGADVFEIREGADPEPASGQVRVNVKAAGVNFAGTKTF